MKPLACCLALLLLAPARAGAECTEYARARPTERPRTISYTEEARREGAEGRLVLRVAVSATGTVTRVELQSGVHPALDREAVAAVRTWRFQPARLCGQAVEGLYRVARRFEIAD